MTVSDRVAEAPNLSFSRNRELVAFLEQLGARRIEHTQRTFLDHLVGTAAILERWGARDAVCQAGLFHSIYGTEYFGDAVLSFDDRDRVRSVLGAEAERLAYVFCAFDRNSIHGAMRRSPPSVRQFQGDALIEISVAEMSDLFWILFANELEQAPFQTLSVDAKAWRRRSILGSARHLPERALRDLEAFYGSLQA
jgi:hypothetical protein